MSTGGNGQAYQQPYQPSSGLGRLPGMTPIQGSRAPVAAYSQTSPGYGQQGKGGQGARLAQPRMMDANPLFGSQLNKPADFGPFAPNVPPQQGPATQPGNFGPLAPQPPVNRPVPPQYASLLAANPGSYIDEQGVPRFGAPQDMIGQYSTRTGDGFTGVRNGQNFVNGQLFAAEGLNQGDANNPLGAGFGNWLRAHQSRLGGTAASYVPPGGWR